MDEVGDIKSLFCCIKGNNSIFAEIILKGTPAFVKNIIPEFTHKLVKMIHCIIGTSTQANRRNLTSIFLNALFHQTTNFETWNARWV